MCDTVICFTCKKVRSSGHFNLVSVLGVFDNDAKLRVSNNPPPPPPPKAYPLLETFWHQCDTFYALVSRGKLRGYFLTLF